MRKSLFTSIATATLAFATGASAAEFGHTVSLKATVPPICSLSGTPTPVTTSGAQFSSVTNGTSELTVAVTPAGVAEQTASLTFANGYCNTSSTHIVVLKGPLKTGEDVPAGFKGKIAYTASILWGGSEPVVDVPVSSDTEEGYVSAVSAPFVISIKVPADSGPFLADHYMGDLVVKVGPNV